MGRGNELKPLLGTPSVSETGIESLESARGHLGYVLPKKKEGLRPFLKEDVSSDL